MYYITALTLLYLLEVKENENIKREYGQAEWLTPFTMLYPVENFNPLSEDKFSILTPLSMYYRPSFIVLTWSKGKRRQQATTRPGWASTRSGRWRWPRPSATHSRSSPCSSCSLCSCSICRQNSILTRFLLKVKIRFKKTGQVRLGLAHRGFLTVIEKEKP